MKEYYSNNLNIPDTEPPRIVIIGGGFAGIRLAFGLKKKGFQVVLFDRNNYHTFQPLLYQVATAGLEPDSIAGPLRKQLEPDSDFFFRMAEVQSINTKYKKVITEIGDLQYDYLVIANGSQTNYYGNQSIEENAFPLKQITHALDLRHHILQNFEAAVNRGNAENIETYLSIVIAGGGPTGVELAGALGELKKSVLPRDYPEMNFNDMKIILVEGMDRLLGTMRKKSSDRALKYLQRFGVEIRLNTMVQSFDGEHVELSDGKHIETRTLIWASGVKGNLIRGLPDDSVEDDRIKVDQYNRVIETDDVYAIGDIARMKTPEYPIGHPMLAPVTIQQASLLAKNLQKIKENVPPEKFRYKNKGVMATIGRNKAVVDLPGNISLGGLMAWFIWMFVHLVSIYGLRNKLVVFINWIYNYFTYDKGTRLIIRKFTPRFIRMKIPQ